MNLEIINRAKNKDEEAFSLIVNNYKNYVFAIILNFIKDEKEAENIAQEVFLQIYLSLDKYTDGSFKSWISRLTANKTIDYLRKKKVDFREETVRDSQVLIDSLKSMPSPEEGLILREKSDELKKICQDLPDIYYQVIYGFYILGRSYKELAEEEGVSEKTIASRLYRAKILLKENWGDYDAL